MRIRCLPKFEYLAPKTLEEALALLDKHKDRAKVIAGGTDFLPKMKSWEATPQYLIGLKNVPGLDYIEHSNTKGLRFGALATLHSIEVSPIIQEGFGVLAQAARSIGSAQIRNVGTVAGNLCMAVPSADTAPALIVLGAKLKLVSLKGERIVPVEEFFAGPFQTVLGKAELLTEIQVPNLLPCSGGVYLKYTLRRAMDLAIVGVAAMIISDNGTCREVKIALGAVAPAPFRATKAEAVLNQKVAKDELIEETAQVASEEARPISDIRASAEYRREIVRVLTRRAVKQAWEKARQPQVAR
jgi:carbon-monoxide dehydrogenase medium subunit